MDTCFRGITDNKEVQWSGILPKRTVLLQREALRYPRNHRRAVSIINNEIQQLTLSSPVRKPVLLGDLNPHRVSNQVEEASLRGSDVPRKTNTKNTVGSVTGLQFAHPLLLEQRRVFRGYASCYCNYQWPSGSAGVTVCSVPPCAVDSKSGNYKWCKLHGMQRVSLQWGTAD